MKYIYIALMLIVAGSCKKSKTADSEIVDNFVKEVKAERYREITLPAFNASHIEALMQHALAIEVGSAGSITKLLRKIR